jgi:hypothetical protein
VGVPAAYASPEHPRLFSGAAEQIAGRERSLMGWGTLSLTNRPLKELECVNVDFGELANETEPGGEGNSEKVRAYGKILEWTATGHSSQSFTKLSSICNESEGYIAWAAVEPELNLVFEKAKVKEPGTEPERLVIKEVMRHNPSLPWAQETKGEETANGPLFWLRTGVAMPLAGTELLHGVNCGTKECTERSAEKTEKEQTVAEEAVAGVPTERRTGCYHHPELTELVREPGYSRPHETELAVRPAPQGCIRFDFVIPQIAFETAVQGSLEPEWKNGAKNALSPSKMEYRGGFINRTKESEIESTEERSSERNERYLTSAFGPFYYRSPIPTKLFGFTNEELLRIQ